MTATNAPVARSDRARGGRRWVELWVRAPPVWADDGRHAGLVARLERLEAAGWLDGLEVRTWGPSVDATARPRTSRDAVARNRVDAFRAWARRTDRVLPGFETARTCGEGRMGEERTVVRVPAVTLAAYRGDVVEWVAPVADAAGLHTTAEWVAAAERRAFGTPADADGDGGGCEPPAGGGRRDRDDRRRRPAYTA